MPSKKPHAGSLEADMATLVKLVETLENQDIPLEQSLQAFERGIELIRGAQERLAAAEQKVNLLLEADGEPATQPLDTPGDGE